MEAEPVMAVVVVKTVVAFFLGGLVLFFLYVYESMVLKPRRLRSNLQKQGIRGPSPSILLGNIPEIKKIQLEARSRTPPNDNLSDVVSIAHDWPSTVLSHLLQWRNEYGTSLSYHFFSVLFFIICFLNFNLAQIYIYG